MSTRLETAYYDLGRLDLLAENSSSIHRLDPRAKVIVTLFFIVCVVSFDRYEIARLLPFFLFPALLIGMAHVPFFYLIRKLLVVSPFVLLIGIFNPIVDRQIILQVGSLEVSGGWVSFLSIILRFILTVGAALLLIATTGFPAICKALEKLGLPRVFTVQMLMLYRYIFVLIEETIRLIRGYTLRSFSKRKMDFPIFKQLLGNLLLRTLDRAQRIHMAMLSRAFTGEIHIIKRFTFGWPELVFVLGWIIVFIYLRFYNVSYMIGKFILE